MTRQFFQTVSMAAAIALGASAAIGSFTQPSYAATFPGIDFICRQDSSNQWTTFAKKDTIESALIRWNYQTPTLTPQERCVEVTARLNSFNLNNKLDFLTTGIRNNLPIICAVATSTTPCNNISGLQLFTLHPNDKSPQARNNAWSKLMTHLYLNPTNLATVLQDSESPLYIDMREYVRAAFAEEGGSADSSQR
jgi:hypothetical protein